MNVQNVNKWALQPDVCRCCLSASGVWDLNALHVSEGLEIVYKDILMSCFGITLSNLSDWGNSHYVCKLCVTQLCDANTFRKQVLDAETTYLEYYNSLKDNIKSDDDDTFKTTTDDNKPVITNKVTRVKERTRAKVRKRDKSQDYDSDTPIASLVNKIELSPENSRDNITKDVELRIDNSKSYSLLSEGLSPSTKKGAKQISERKRVILTSNIILKDTTACPFRHHKSWFQCFFCTQDFMQLNLLREHTSNSHQNIDKELKQIKRFPRSLQIDISNLKCRECDLTLTDVEIMRRHFGSVHGKVIYKECVADYKINSSPYTCHLCGLEFHVFRTLTTHLNEHYANCICDICGRSFLNKKRLKVHKETHEFGHYPCTQCDKILKSKSAKANHIESVHSKRIIKCQICSKPMKHYNDRIKHMSEVHNITHKFKCPICSREYNIKHYLATHIRQTHGHKNKKCLECGMSFVTGHGLKKHALRHAGQKNQKLNT